MKILVIRGGALGDFILTLPTLRLLRERWPDAHLELLGHPATAEIALRRGYLHAVRSVDRGPLSTFFMPRAVLDPAWMDYFGGFDLILSYFYDPDGLFAANLKRCDPGRLLTHSPQVPPDAARPAAHHFAAALEPLGLHLGADASSQLFPTEEDEADADAFLSGLPTGTRLVAVHPGSGGETKNWPLASWAELGRRLTETDLRLTLLLVEGEADVETAGRLPAFWQGVPYLRARHLPLPILAALLARAALFIGHDSGITHLAAGARRDLPVLALFGPTDPAVWAPPRPGVEVVRAQGAMSGLTASEIFSAARTLLDRPAC